MPTATRTQKQQKLPVHRQVTIAGTFGSNMQREVSMRTLTSLLAIWQREVESRHKKNKLTITMDDHLVC